MTIITTTLYISFLAAVVLSCAGMLFNLSETVVYYSIQGSCFLVFAAIISSIMEA